MKPRKMLQTTKVKMIKLFRRRAMIKLESSDKREFKVDKRVMVESLAITNILTGPGSHSPIRVSQVNGDILSLVIKYCRRHAKASMSNDRADEDLKTWDAKFVEVDDAVLFDLILAAKYLNIKSLLNLTCQRVADMNTRKIPEVVPDDWLWTRPGKPKKLDE